MIFLSALLFVSIGFFYYQPLIVFFEKKSVGFQQEIFTQSLKKKMVLVPGSFFKIGCPDSIKLPCDADEWPQKKIYVRSFYLDETPLTYSEFTHFVRAGGKKNAYWRYESYNQPKQPVTGLSWNDAACLANFRSIQEGLSPVYKQSNQYDQWGHPIYSIDHSANGYRLPTEAEYEYAARGGLTDKAFPWGNDFAPEFANYDEGHGVIKGKWWRLANVYEQKKNNFGLYGMSGNVWVFTQDWYGDYQELSWNNPTGPATGDVKSIRGGSWGSIHPAELRVSNRSFIAIGNYNYDIGIRMVLPLSEKIKNNLKNKIIDSRKKNSINAQTIQWQDYCHLPVRIPKPILKFDQGFRARLTKFLQEYFQESVYFKRQIDQQPKISPRELADLITDISLEHKVHPLFLTGIMASESGMGTVSFARWFNNPMAYHWANWKMEYGLPEYNPRPARNRKYRNLAEGFAAYTKGIRRPLYIRAARQSFYRFHHIYVGYEAKEWMQTLARVYHDVAGIHFNEQIPTKNAGQHIYLDWQDLVK